MLEKIKSLLNANIVLQYKMKWSDCTSQYVQSGKITELKESIFNGYEIIFDSRTDGVIFIPVKNILSIKIV